MDKAQLVAIAVHVTGLIALLLIVTGLIARDDKLLRHTAFWGSLFTIAHNALIGSATATALCAIIFFRNYSAIRPESLGKWRRIWLCAGFVSATFVAAAITWSGPVSAVLALGSACVTYGFFYLGDIRLRLVIGSNNLAWLSNAIAYHSPWQFAVGCLSALAAFAGAWRIQTARRESANASAHMSCKPSPTPSQN